MPRPCPWYHCSVLSMFCQPPSFWGGLVMVTTIPCHTCRLSAGPRRALPFRGPHRAGGGDCGTRFLVGFHARRPQAAELWGGVTYTRPTGRAPPRGGPKTALMGRGGPATTAGRPRPAGCYGRAGGDGARPAACGRAFQPCRGPCRCGTWRGGAPNRFGVARQCIWGPPPARGRRADPRKAGADGQGRRGGAQIH